MSYSETRQDIKLSSSAPSRGTRRLRDLLGSNTATGVNLIPVLIGLVLVCVVFSLLNDRFLSAVNLTNLVLQTVAIGTMAIGVVLVLLLGQIDLSIGSVSGLTAAATALLNVEAGLSAWAAILMGLALGTLVGIVHGTIVAVLGVPSFVVTLGGLIGWQGLHLYLLGDSGSLNINDPGIVALANHFFPAWLGWLVALVATIAVVWMMSRRRSRRTQFGLAQRPWWIDAVRVAAFVVVVVGAVLTFASNRGVPLAGLILLALILLMDFVCRRTLLGRRMYAIGGDPQAAARVGINTRFVKIVVFALASTFAAAGGILSSSRVMSVSQGSGGGEILLYAIAAAVIGGTSLYGGRGSVWAALLGALLIGAISNGMDLLGLASPIKYMITGVVLVAAVTFDSVMRNRRGG